MLRKRTVGTNDEQSTMKHRVLTGIYDGSDGTNNDVSQSTVTASAQQQFQLAATESGMNPICCWPHPDLDDMVFCRSKMKYDEWKWTTIEEIENQKGFDRSKDLTKLYECTVEMVYVCDRDNDRTTKRRKDLFYKFRRERTVDVPACPGSIILYEFNKFYGLYRLDFHPTDRTTAEFSLVLFTKDLTGMKCLHNWQYFPGYNARLPRHNKQVLLTMEYWNTRHTYSFMFQDSLCADSFSHELRNLRGRFDEEYKEFASLIWRHLTSLDWSGNINAICPEDATKYIEVSLRGANYADFIDEDYYDENPEEEDSKWTLLDKGIIDAFEHLFGRTKDGMNYRDRLPLAWNESGRLKQASFNPCRTFGCTDPNICLPGQLSHLKFLETLDLINFDVYPQWVLPNLQNLSELRLCIRPNILDIDDRNVTLPALKNLSISWWTNYDDCQDLSLFQWFGKWNLPQLEELTLLQIEEYSDHTDYFSEMKTIIQKLDPKTVQRLTVGFRSDHTYHWPDDDNDDDDSSDSDDECSPHHDWVTKIILEVVPNYLPKVRSISIVNITQEGVLSEGLCFDHATMLIKTLADRISNGHFHPNFGLTTAKNLVALNLLHHDDPLEANNDVLSILHSFLRLHNLTINCDARLHGPRRAAYDKEAQERLAQQQKVIYGHIRYMTKLNSSGLRSLLPYDAAKHVVICTDHPQLFRSDHLKAIDQRHSANHTKKHIIPLSLWPNVLEGQDPSIIYGALRVRSKYDGLAPAMEGISHRGDYYKARKDDE